MTLAMMHAWMMGAWWLLAIAVVAVAIAAVIAVQHGSGFTPRRRALDLLDERYASGEIDENEYRQRKRLLERH